MIEIESVAPSTTPELPEIPMAHLKESHVSENDVPSNKCIVSQFDAIVKESNLESKITLIAFTTVIKLHEGDAQ